MSDIDQVIKQKDQAYKERNVCIAALAYFIKEIAQPGFRVYVAYHPYDDESWEDDWRTILVIEKGDLQMTWHFHDSEKYLLSKFPVVNVYKWDGHNSKNIPY